MLRKLHITLIFILLFVISFGTVYADVNTTLDNERKENAVYIVGNPDLYPIEFYNEETLAFEGVLPELLKDVSDSTGVNFIYVYNENMTSVDLKHKYKAELLSSYNTDQNKDFFTDIVTFVSYKNQYTNMNVGWKFTEYADQNLRDILNEAALNIDSTRINALLIEYGKQVPKHNHEFVLYFIIFIVALLIIVTIMTIWAIRYKKITKKKEITDAATGIGNLTYFMNQFVNAQDNLNYIAYIVIDANYFQAYHSQATLVNAIKYIANTLSGYATNNDIVARITENDFAFVFNSENGKSARDFVTDISTQLSLYLDEEKNDGTPYFRIVYYNLTENDNNPDALLFNLRKNCTKLIGTDKIISLCSENMMNAAIEEKRFIDAVLKAMRNNDFKMHLQFIYDNKNNIITSAEALSRWDRGEEGLMYPGSYIGEMEKLGIITEFDYYMFEQACIQLHKWNETEFENINISCNITRVTISENNFVERITDITNKYIFDRSKLTIEITEDALENNKEVVSNNILKCKEVGFKFALDDLGSGYTSLTNLCDYPFDVVKIDRSILLKTETENGRALFEGIEAFAHKLGLLIVCEGVETDEQRYYISATECDHVQGWYFCKAIPVKDAEKLYLQRK